MGYAKKRTGYSADEMADVIAGGAVDATQMGKVSR